MSTEGIYQDPPGLPRSYDSFDIRMHALDGDYDLTNGHDFIIDLLRKLGNLGNVTIEDATIKMGRDEGFVALIDDDSLNSMGLDEQVYPGRLAEYLPVGIQFTLNLNNCPITNDPVILSSSRQEMFAAAIADFVRQLIERTAARYYLLTDTRLTSDLNSRPSVTKQDQVLIANCKIAVSIIFKTIKNPFMPERF